MADPRHDLIDMLAREAAAPVQPWVSAAAEVVRARHGEAVRALVFYGSCLRDNDPDGLLDFYVLVGRYGDAYENWSAAAANRLLPPNVFYLETLWEGAVVRAKYAVMSLDQFAAGALPRTLQPMIWARFAQPARLVYSADDDARRLVAAAQADAVTTLMAVTRRLLPHESRPEVLWPRAFAETYRAELRPEPPGRAGQLFEADRARYDRLTPLALAGDSWAPWWLRRVVGKALNVARLIKAAFTFDGAVDYLLWKVERHSGIGVTATPWQRRHPLLAAPGLLWRLYRRGAFR
jgi:hypothetical protein